MRGDTCRRPGFPGPIPRIGRPLVSIVVASGTGPYWAGKMSTVTGSLTTGTLSLFALAPVVLLPTARRLPQETPAARVARAVAAG